MRWRHVVCSPVVTDWSASAHGRRSATTTAGGYVARGQRVLAAVTEPSTSFTLRFPKYIFNVIRDLGVKNRRFSSQPRAERNANILAFLP